MDLHGPQWSRTRKRIERAAARLLGSHGGGSDGKRNSNPCRLLQSHSNLSQNRFSNARQSNHYRKKIFGPLWSTFGRLLWLSLRLRLFFFVVSISFPALAAARAYDTAVFYLRGPTARLNFPELLTGEKFTEEDMSAATIRKKATEVGAQVDALGSAVLDNRHRVFGQDQESCDDNKNFHRNYQNGDGEEHEDDEDEKRLKSGGWLLERVDLNKLPDPESSDEDWESK
ncbi:hypothetical protein F2Q70_00031169 [Brassica cretica]|uniref:AP2/ERF domain-containing protein n=1 Tax=Brassica cretica TaxID=69181 RepID=A0A8S9FL00_BRACR|nr:hypothetical protein F2Q70_00031169 [Brassica cretica]